MSSLRYEIIFAIVIFWLLMLTVILYFIVNPTSKVSTIYEVTGTPSTDRAYYVMARSPVVIDLPAIESKDKVSGVILLHARWEGNTLVLSPVSALDLVSNISNHK